MKERVKNKERKSKEVFILFYFVLFILFTNLIISVTVAFAIFPASLYLLRTSGEFKEGSVSSLVSVFPSNSDMFLMADFISLQKIKINFFIS